jgi:hypothetical protein
MRAGILACSSVPGSGLKVRLIIVTAVTITISIAVAVMLHVVHCAAITFLEAVAEFAAVVLVDWRMLVHLVIIGIGVTAIHVVTARSLDTFTEALALGVAITVGSAIPIAIAILILVLSLGSAVLGIARVLLLGGCLDCCRGCHTESESGNREPLYVFHKIRTSTGANSTYRGMRWGWKGVRCPSAGLPGVERNRSRKGCEGRELEFS